MVEVIGASRSPKPEGSKEVRQLRACSCVRHVLQNAMIRCRPFCSRQLEENETQL